MTPSYFLPTIMTLGLLSFSPVGGSAPASDPHGLAQAPDALLSGVQRAIAYSGFRHGQHPARDDKEASMPSDAEILEDLQILAYRERFGLIRLYDSKENSADVLRIIQEHEIPIKVMLGIWLDGELSNHEGCAWVTEPVPEHILAEKAASNRVEVESGIRLANQYPDIVAAVNVGNESLVTWNDHLVSLESMISYLKQVKDAIAQPVTTADNFKVFSQYGRALADHIDFLAVHTYPIWEYKTIEQTLPYSIENLKEIRAVLPDIPMVIAEAGWPSTASEFPEQASVDNMARHFQELMSFGKANNITVFWFEAFDEDWKGAPDNPLGAEKHWGLYYIDRSPKSPELTDF